MHLENVRVPERPPEQLHAVPHALRQRVHHVVLTGAAMIVYFLEVLRGELHVGWGNKEKNKHM